MIVQARVVEIVYRLGLFYLKLKVDDITGATEEPSQVQERAAELRYCFCSCAARCTILQLLKAPYSA
jgi:hypothetical protein